MIEEGLFTHFLKPLQRKKTEKDSVMSIIQKFLNKDCTIQVDGLVVKVKNISLTHKKELSLQKELIETDLETLLSKKYIITF